MKGGLSLGHPVTPSYRLSEETIFLLNERLALDHAANQGTESPSDTSKIARVGALGSVLMSLNFHSFFLFPSNDGSYRNPQKITMARLVLETRRNKEPQ